MSAAIIACHDCDLLHRAQRVPAGSRARCGRCGGVLYREKKNSIQRTLALALAGSILFVVANLLPFLSFDMQGQVIETTLTSGVLELYDQGRPGLSALVLLTAILAPAIQLTLYLYLLLPIWLGRRPVGLALVFRTLKRVQPWSMMEVFLLGILVALVKLSDMADIVPGLGIWSFALLILVLAGATASLDDRLIWKQVEVTA